MIQHFDLFLFHLVNGWCGNWALDRIVAYEERNQLLKGGLLLAAYCWFWFTPAEPRRVANRRQIVAAVIGVFIALVLARTLAAALPLRVRPMYVPDIGYRPPSLAMPMNLEDWNSFPSDTATFFVALAFGLFRLCRPLGWLLLGWVAVWICLPRLYLGVHYPSDLLVGAMLGVATVWICCGLMARQGWLARRIMAAVNTAERRRPSLFYAAAFALAYEMTVIFNDIRNIVRALLHAVQWAGYAAPRESLLLLLLLAGVLAVGAAAVGLVLLYRRRRRLPRQAAWRRVSLPGE